MPPYIEELPPIGPSENESSRQSEIQKWPIPSPRMFHGLAGDLVRVLEPATEADNAAILMQFLAFFGSALTSSAHYLVESTRQTTNLFVLIVGATAKGRKGTALAQVLNVFKQIDESWTTNRITNGLSSGEGLIYAVRDQTTKTTSRRDRESGQTIHEEVIEDSGVSDKRLLVIESEFAQTQRVMKRDGSTLSAVVRQAWDSGNLRTLTRNNSIQATGAHISIIGHITLEEFRRELDKTEAANGFLNRFLIVASRRSKLLPNGGTLDETSLAQIIRRIGHALEFGRRKSSILRDHEAAQLWVEAYHRLSNSVPGMLGAATSRAEAQVTRLSVLYALLDQSPVIQIQHLHAALAAWDYCYQSASYIFGGSSGNVCADQILQSLRTHEAGLTQTEISHKLGRNRSAHEIRIALALLEEYGMIRKEAGHPAARWKFVEFVQFVPPEEENSL